MTSFFDPLECHSMWICTGNGNPAASLACSIMRQMPIRPKGWPSPGRIATREAEALVSLRRDETDYAVAFKPDDVIVFRNPGANALRKLCRQLRWEIISDTSYTLEDL